MHGTGCAAVCASLYATTVAQTVINLPSDYPVTQQGIACAVKRAKSELGNAETVEVRFAAGTYNITQTADLFEVSGVAPKAGGQLIFSGAGMYETVLMVDTNNNNVIHGQNVRRVVWRDLTFARPNYTATQGTVVSTRNGEVVLDIAPGFPTPGALVLARAGRGLKPGQGQYLRRFDASDPLLPKIVPDNNEQVHWNNVSQPDPTAHPRRWAFATSGKPPYEAGHQIAVKCKHGGQSYFMSGGDDVAFLRVRWTGHSRGVIRGGISNVQFIGCRVERMPPIQGAAAFLSTSGGGPQIGQCADDAIHNVTVRDHWSEGTGDDSIATFRVKSGVISNNTIYDSFARGILLASAGSDLRVVDNDVFRSVGGDGGLKHSC